jgi:hypothetical protein
MRVSTLNRLLFAVPLASVLAQTPAPDLQMNAVYVCNDGLAFKVFSCANNTAMAPCELQNYRNGQAFQRGVLLHKQLTDLLPARCHLQTPAEAQANPQRGDIPRGAPAPGGAPTNAAAAGGQAGPGGIKVGDTVRVLIDGWGEAKVVAVRGVSFVVLLPNGIQVSKMWPYEVHRLGKLTAEDHAAGQYDINDRVQVLINGRWAEGVVRGMNLNMYTIKVPGYRGDFDSDQVSTTPENIRISNTPPPPPPAQRAAGQAPKAGLSSCAGKYEGRWEMVPGGLRIVFRGGTANISEPLSSPVAYECFMGGGQVMFYKPGEFKPTDYLTLLPNNDGTLQSELGPLKKMGN